MPVYSPVSGLTTQFERNYIGREHVSIKATSDMVEWFVVVEDLVLIEKGQASCKCIFHLKKII